MTVETEVAALTSAVNLLTSTVNVSKATLDASVAAAEAAYDSFDDRYLGAKVSAPSLDNDGGSLLTGALYFNSTENAMYVYTGASWVITTNYNNVTAPYTLAQTLNTNGNNVTFGDNGKAIFGAGSDLQIYHDGTTNKVVGSINVTGTATMDGLTVEGNALLKASTSTLQFRSSDGASYGYNLKANISNTVDFGFLIEDLAGKDLLKIESNNDISFYEDTGTTAKLTWDASAESLNFADNGKAIFGAGSDLQIYHDGTDSFISDQGTGNLKLLANDFRLANAANNELMLRADQSSAVTAYYAGTAKLATTATGIDVTGTATMDGLTVEGNVSIGTQNTGSGKTLQFLGAGGSEHRINFADGVSTDVFSVHYDGTDASPSNDLYIESFGNKLIKFDQNGDISFYEDTGTTPKFFWDASAESLGIGTSSPSAQLTLSGDTTQIRLENTASGGRNWALRTFGSALGIYDHTAGAFRQYIDSSGRVGIGTSSPATTFHVDSGTANNVATFSSTDANALIKFEDSATTTETTLGAYANDMVFRVGAAERLRIDSSGDMIMKGGRIKVRESDDGNDAVVITRDSDEGYVNLYSEGSQTIEIRGNGNSYFNGGNVGIGTSSPSGLLDLTTAFSTSLDIEGGDNNSKNIIFRKTTGGTQQAKITVIGDALQFFTGPTDERMRIDSSGNLLVGTTAADGDGLSIKPRASGGGTTTQLLFDRADTATSGFAVVFHNNSSLVGSITYTNSATAFNTSSDQRLKENIADADDAGSKIDAIQVRQYDWKADGSHQDYGMVAQELLEVAPEAVSVPEDLEEMMGVDYSKLVPMLIKEIQSLRNRVAQLEGI